jgi:hypothetical protein
LANGFRVPRSNRVIRWIPALLTIGASAPYTAKPPKPLRCSSIGAGAEKLSFVPTIATS